MKNIIPIWNNNNMLTKDLIKLIGEKEKEQFVSLFRKT
tara:strand:+ start:716 stop:829 length:114 start_codon:yes stop_codon:yes gene_type:complete